MADLKKTEFDVAGVPGAVSACDTICVLAGNMKGLAPENKSAVEQIVGLAQGLRAAYTGADPDALYPYPYKVDMGRVLRVGEIPVEPIVQPAHYGDKPAGWGEKVVVPPVRDEAAAAKHARK